MSLSMSCLVVCDGLNGNVCNRPIGSGTIMKCGLVGVSVALLL